MIFLNIILIILIAYILIKSHNNKTKASETFKQQKAVQIKVNTEVENWQMKAQILKDELQKQNQLIVLEGRREVKYVFDYTKREIQYQGKDNAVKFLTAKLNELKTKEISVQTTYDYIFSFDLSDIDVETEDGKLHIVLQRGSVHLKPLAEDSSTRVISSDIGVLSGGQFTPQQTSAVLYTIMVHTHNNLVNDNDLYVLALTNAKTDIEELASKMGIKNIEFEILNTETIENDDVEVISDNN